MATTSSGATSTRATSPPTPSAANGDIPPGWSYDPSSWREMIGPAMDEMLASLQYLKRSRQNAFSRA